MELITVRELFKNTEKYVDQEIEIGGWVRNKRPSKQFGFIVLNDGTYFTPVQVVYNDSIENFQEISKINIGAALIVKGTLVLTPGAKQYVQNLELLTGAEALYAELGMNPTTIIIIAAIGGGVVLIAAAVVVLLVLKKKKA